MNDRLPDVVISAGEALFLATVGEVVFPSCSRGWAADGEVFSPSCSRGWTARAVVPAVVTAEIAAGAGAGAAMRAIVVAATRVAGAAARLSACLAGLVHELHLQTGFGRHPHGQRLTCGIRRFFSFVPTETSPRERAHVPGLSIRSHLIAYKQVSFGKRGVKLFSTMRFVSRAGIIIWATAKNGSSRCILAKNGCTLKTIAA